MTQHLDRPVTPMIDTSVDAATTTPAGGTPQVQNPGWPPPPAGMQPGAMVPGAMVPEPPLNTLSWLSVVCAFVVSPVAIVLGAISRRQIARTGERGRGLATTGIALGIVFTLMGIVSTIMVLSMVTTVTYTPAVAPAPVPAASAPSPDTSAPSAGSGSSAGSSGSSTASTGQADLLSAYLDLIGANQTLQANFEAHSGAAALKADLAAYRAEVQQFRDTVAAADLSAEQRSQVDGQLIPAIDKVLADLDAIAKTSNQGKLESAAGAFDIDNPAMVEIASTVISG